MTNIWNTETCYEIDERRPGFAVIPIGSFEQHGPHLPVTTDTLIAGLVAKAICDTLGGMLVSPITISCSHEHAGFPASLSISGDTLFRVLADVIASIEAYGPRLTVLVNGHGGNYLIGNLAQQLNEAAPRVFACPTRQHWQSAMDHAGIEHTISEDMHGGEIETSILMHAMPEVVRTDRIADCEATDRPLLTALGMRHYTTTGIIGFPSRASEMKGRLLMEQLVSVISADIRYLLSRIGG